MSITASPSSRGESLSAESRGTCWEPPSLGLAALSVGMAGYHWLEGLTWVDAYLNAAMILGGMGQVTKLHTNAGKLFAGSYALFAGMVFVVGAGVVLAPVVHRAMHRFHLGDSK